MLFESELDWAQGAASAYYEPYSALPAVLATHVLFESGDHGLFHNDCRAMPAWVDIGFGFVLLRCGLGHGQSPRPDQSLRDRLPAG